MRMKKEEYNPAVNDRVLAEDGEGRVVSIHEQRRTATILMDDGKTVVAAWEDVARAEVVEQDGCPHRAPQRPHLQRRERMPREAHDGRERRERPARQQRAEHAPHESRENRAAQERSAKPRRQNTKRRQNRPRPPRDEAPHE